MEQVQWEIYSQMENVENLEIKWIKLVSYFIKKNFSPVINCCYWFYKVKKLWKTFVIELNSFCCVES